MRCVDSIYSRYSRSFPDACTAESVHLLILRVPHGLQPAVQAFLTHVKATPDPDRFQIPAVRELVCQSARDREPSNHVIHADVALFLFSTSIPSPRSPHTFGTAGSHTILPGNYPGYGQFCSNTFDTATTSILHDGEQHARYSLRYNRCFTTSYARTSQCARITRYFTPSKAAERPTEASGTVTEGGAP